MLINFLKIMFCNESEPETVKTEPSFNIDKDEDLEDVRSLSSNEIMVKTLDGKKHIDYTQGHTTKDEFSRRIRQNGFKQQYGEMEIKYPSTQIEKIIYKKDDA